MKLRNILLFLGSCMLAAAAGISVEAQRAKRNVAPGAGAESSFVRITQKEIELLLADMGAVNPQVSERLREDAELRRLQLENLKQLLAFARQAEKDGLAALPVNARELKNIREETIAVIYDRHLNEGKGSTAPFSLITDARVNAYWGEAGNKLTASLRSARTARFQEFLNTKIALLKADNPQMQDKAITEEERQQARDLYAKIQIYFDEYKRRSSQLPRLFHDKVDLQVKLQQAQFLARIYAAKMAPRTLVSPAEIDAYIKAHPELDPVARRAKANEILERAKKGEDFAKLANEFSEDPGNMNDRNEPQGGLYKNVGKGVMVPPFEHAALALEAGQIAPGLVVSDFGFHIVKLERKGKSSASDTAETYDVRHILIASAGKPGFDGHPDSIKEQVKQALEKEKEERIIAELVAANKISVPADFTVPVSPPDVEPAKTATPAKARQAKPRSTRKRN